MLNSVSSSSSKLTCFFVHLLLSIKHASLIHAAPVVVEDKGAVILNYSNWPQTSPAFYALMVAFDFSLSPWPWPFMPWTSSSKRPLKSWNSLLCLPRLQIFQLKHPRPCQTGYLLEKPPRGKIQVFPPALPPLLFTPFFLWFELWAVSSLQPVNYPGIQHKFSSMWVPISFFAMLYCSSQEKTVVSAEKSKMSSPECLAGPLLLWCWEVLSKGYWTSKPSASLWTWLMSFQRVMRSWKCGQDCLPPSQAFTKPMSASLQVLPWKHVVTS